MIGASCATVTCHRSPSQGGATGPKQLGKRKVHRHREGLHQADQQRGEEAPGERTEAADDDDDKENGPKRRRHRRLGDQRRAGDHARQSRQRRARAEHQHEHPRHVVAERR